MTPDSWLFDSINCVNAGNLVRKSGTSPENPLFERSKTSRLINPSRLLGIGPSKWLLLRFKEICKLGGIFGIRPLSLFPPSSSSIRDARLLMDSGIEPLRLFCCKFRRLRPFKLDIVDGIDPLREFQLKFSIDSFCSWAI